MHLELKETVELLESLKQTTTRHLQEYFGLTEQEPLRIKSFIDSANSFSSSIFFKQFNQYEAYDRSHINRFFVTSLFLP